MHLAILICDMLDWYKKREYHRKCENAEVMQRQTVSEEVIKRVKNWQTLKKR